MICVRGSASRDYNLKEFRKTGKIGSYVIKASKSQRRTKMSRIRGVIWSLKLRRREPLGAAAATAARSESISHLAFQAALRITPRPIPLSTANPRLHTSTEDINNAGSKVLPGFKVFLLPSSHLPPTFSCIFYSSRPMVQEAMNFAQKMTNERSQEVAGSREERWSEAKAQPWSRNLLGLFLS